MNTTHKKFLVVHENGREGIYAGPYIDGDFDNSNEAWEFAHGLAKDRTSDGWYARVYVVTRDEYFGGDK